MLNRKYVAPIVTFLFFFMLVFSMAKVIAASAQEIAIEAVMKSQWDKPEAPLTVAPIVIVNHYAVAGWSQNTKGGRALLKQNGGRWDVLFCGDTSLKSISVLEQSGMSLEDATRMSDELNKAEEKVSAEQIDLLDTFKGVVKVDASHHQH